MATASIDRTQFNADLTQMQKDAEAWASQVFNVGFNAELNQASMAAVKSELDAVTAPRTVEIRVDGGSLSALALGIQHSLEQALAGAVIGGRLPVVRGGGGLLALLGWRTGLLGIGAGFGSLLSLMGLGFEHLLATAIGVAGSMAGAFLGAFALMAGSFSIMAVGMGSDMMVSMSAIADTKTLGTALTAVNTAVLQYGAGSTQAAAATANLNLQMALLGNTAGVLAELQLAKAIQALNSYWDQATSGARVAFVNMVTPLLAIAYTYIPLVAASATRNFGLITAGLKPVIAYLDGPATAVFQELENIFAIRLPVAMDAFNQGIQLLINTLGYLAGWTTGGFMTSLDKLFTYLNTPVGFARWESGLASVIGLFHDWWGLLKQVLITIYDIFKPSVGLGSAIATTLTSMLKSLDAWIASTSGKAELRNIFTVHKTEVIELLKFLGNLLAVGGQMMIVVIPPFVTLANILLTIGNTILHIPFVGTIVAWGAVLLILISRMKLVALWGALMTIPAKAMALWSGAVGIFTALTAVIEGDNVAWLALRTSVLGTAAAFAIEKVQAALAWIATLGPFALIVIGIAALIAAIVLLVTHWKQVSAAVGQVWVDIRVGLAVALAVVESWFGSLGGTIRSWLSGAGTWLISVGEAIINGIVTGIRNSVGRVESALGNVVSIIKRIPVIGGLIGSDSPYFATVGQAIGHGLASGITGSSGLPVAATQSMVARVAGVGGGASGQGAGGVSASLLSGLGSGTGSIDAVLAELQAMHQTVKQLPRQARMIQRAT